MNILHITPHLGGGVGKVISGLCINDRKNTHRIFCLEKPVNTQFVDICVQNQIQVLFDADLGKCIRQADAVQVEWWHHPLTAQLISRTLSEIPCRLLIWSHISGCNYPWISPDLVQFADRFVFSTPYSYDNPFYSREEQHRVREQAGLVVSSGNDFTVQPCSKKRHSGFHVGYIGFLGYQKTRPNFVQICEQCADIPDVKFTVVGDPAYGAQLLSDIQNSPEREKFDMRGYSSHVQDELAEFDVFACLLNREHTGASENALLEAMHAGVCPVVFRQCTEQYLVQDGVTGCVCDSEETFVREIHRMYAEPDTRETLGRQASAYVSQNLSIQNTVMGMQREYDVLMKKNKTCHEGFRILGDTPAQWFLSCYRGDPRHLTGLAAGESKGSARQYYHYFRDRNLEKILKENGLWR